MSRRRFEMFQYRQVIVRLRQGDTDREIARSRLMGRRKVTALRRLATERGWLSPDSPLPDDEAIAASVSRHVARRARSQRQSRFGHRSSDGSPRMSGASRFTRL